jgi:hypothetical protein
MAISGTGMFICVSLVVRGAPEIGIASASVAIPGPAAKKAVAPAAAVSLPGSSGERSIRGTCGIPRAPPVSRGGR